MEELLKFAILLQDTSLWLEGYMGAKENNRIWHIYTYIEQESC